VQCSAQSFATRHFQALTARAGLPKIRLHDLRHTNASLALDAGVTLKVVSERLGHTTTAITADIYTHVSSSVGRSAARTAGTTPADARCSTHPRSHVPPVDDPGRGQRRLAARTASARRSLLGYTKVGEVGFGVSELSPYDTDLDWHELTERSVRCFPSQVRPPPDPLCL
jgi:hypothetical protein